MMNAKARPTLRNLFNFTELLSKMKNNPQLSQAEAIGEMVVEQSAGKGAPKSLNKILRSSVEATEAAGAANERAAELRATGARIQIEWDHLCERYAQLEATIARAKDIHSGLESYGADFDLLLSTFSFDEERGKSIHIAVEMAKARIAAPILDEAIKKLRVQLRAHADEMLSFAKQHEIPSACVVGLNDAGE